MSEFLTQAWQDVQLLFERVVQWFAALDYDPRQWDLNTWLVVGGGALLLLLILLAGRRRGRARRGPQFLLTNGQIVLLDDLPVAAAADGGRRQAALLQAPADAAYQLRVTVNNLNPYPVQLLEIAVRTSAGRLPVVADASAVVPPNGAVDVVADITDLPGDRGTLELYLYNNKVAPRSLRLLVPVDWEPWNQRYRVRATAQRLEPSRVVASQSRRRQERAAIRRGRLREVVGAAAQGVSERVAELRRDLALRRERAATERQARLAAEREAAERRRGEHPEGPFSVPLAPSGGRGPAERDAVRRVAVEEEAADDGVAAHARTERTSTEHTSTEHAPTERSPDDVDVNDREPEPRARLEFPDDF